MTVLSIRTFSGEIPNLPTDRLPDGAAQYAVNCDFTAQELRPLQSLGTHYTTGPGAQPCRAIFTADGAKFFAWDTPTRAFLAPTIDDVHGRVYYNTEGNGLRVSQLSAMRDKSDSPRPPAAGASWTVGVKAPETITTTVATGLGLEFYVQTLRFGVMVKESPVLSYSAVTPGVTYSVTIPADALLATSSTVGREPDVGLVSVVDRLLFSEFYVGDGALTFNGRFETSLPPPYDQWSGEVGSNGWVVSKNLNGSFSLHTINYWFNGDPLNTGIQHSEGIFTVLDPSNIIYKGSPIASVSELYDAMRTTQVASNDGVTIRFRGKVFNEDTSVVYFDGTCSHVTGTAPLTYTLTIPPFGTLLGTSSSSAIQTVAYVAVAQNIWGEESAPSSPVLVESRQGLTSVTLNVAHTADANQVPLAGMLFYRTYPSLSGDTTYFLINETPVVVSGGTYTFTDTSVEPVTSTALASNQAEWAVAPDDLKFLTYVGNGSFCGAVGKDLYVSEPYHPHAWAYRLMLPYEIVGLIAVEGGVLATTTLHPYAIYGAHPSQYSQQKIMAEQAGWSNTALSHIEGSAVFASNDGLVRVTGGQASITDSQRLFRRKDWREMYGAVKDNLRLEQHDGRLLGIVDPGA